MKSKRNASGGNNLDAVDTALIEAVEILPEPPRARTKGGAGKRDKGAKGAKSAKGEKRGRRRRRGWGLLLGAGIGAAAMYLLDPQDGARRRALVRDKATRYTRLARENLSGRIENARNRSGGMVSELRSQFRLGAPTDEVLVARVRSKLGHVVSHPAAITVTAQDGQVTLRGPILMSEEDQALMAVRLVPGVTGVENQLEPHDTADGVPGLQGQSATSS